MQSIVLHSVENALTITVFVFVMMVLVDYVNVLSRGRLHRLAAGGRLKQYLFAAILGVLPGCLGSFMAVSLYVHGIIGFGALGACMIATAGDESFVMFALFPLKAAWIHLALLVLGVAGGFLFDGLARRLKLRPCVECQLTEFHHDHDVQLVSPGAIVRQLRDMSLARFLFMVVTGVSLYLLAAGKAGAEGGWERATFTALLALGFCIVTTVPDHYLQDHIWKHIARKHVWKVFLWTCGAILAVNLATAAWDVEGFVKAHMLWVLVSAALVGLIPQSGPHLVFVLMFSQGIVPFSVLFTSCFVQDGHGMLPLLSYSVRDAALIKAVKLVLGLAIGAGLYYLGW